MCLFVRSFEQPFVFVCFKKAVFFTEINSIRMKIKLNNNHNHKFGGTKTAFSIIRNIWKEHNEIRCNECRMHMSLPYVLTFKHSHDVNIVKRFKVQEDDDASTLKPLGLKSKNLNNLYVIHLNVSTGEGK